MKKPLFRSAFLLLLTLSLTSSVSALDFSALSEAVQKGPAQGLEGLASATSGTGSGFYMSIYEDVVRNPNQEVEQAMKQQFGLDYQINLAPARQTGQYVFWDFFKDPWANPETAVEPSITSTIQSDCVRVAAARVDDEARRWRLVRKRLDQRNRAFEAPVSEISPENQRIDRETLNRLIGQVDKTAEERVQAAMELIPSYRGLTDQQQIFNCYQEMSRRASFELQLQTILHPQKKQLEVMQTFVNGRLDDFSHEAVGTDVTYGSSFPRYDLLYDIGVIEMLIFGSPVSSRSGASSRSNASRANENVRTPRTFQDLEDVFPFTGPGDEDGPTVSSSLQSRTVRTSGSSFETVESDADEAEETIEDPDKTKSFGSSSTSFGGPFCVDPHEGISLQYGDSPAEVDDESETDDAGEGLDTEVIRRDVDGELEIVTVETTVTPPPSVQDAGQGDTAEAEIDQDTEGRIAYGNNRQALCEGPLSVDFGNDLLRLLFCIDIEFAKTGKNWETLRDEHCIACHINHMNRTFEQLVFQSSVRPHKNTGTIMESGICEDGFGDDIGFHFFLEVVPVRFYPEICYPTGGVSQEEYAEYVGYPELYQRLKNPGLYIECDKDFPGDEEAVKRCQKALGNRNRYSYDELKQEYQNAMKDQSVPLATVDEPWVSLMNDDGDKYYLADGIEELSDIDPDSNVWARLVGDQGIAEAQLHFFLYRQGKAPPRFGEDELFVKDYELRLQYIRETMDEILRDRSLQVTAETDQKMEQMLCLKGYTQYQCDEYRDTLRRYEDDITRERDRVEFLTGRWNQRSRDFNGENSCQTFSGSGSVDAFLDTFGDAVHGDYYLETDTRRTQSPEQQVTGQVQANTGLQDLGAIFAQIDQQVQYMAESQESERQLEQFQTVQERNLALNSALAVELTAFRAHITAMTNWWADMVDKKQFVSKGGQRINVLQSFLEKLR